MKKGDYVRIDAENIRVDMKQLTDLLNIVIDDFSDSGELEGRRELTISALYIIRDYLALLTDMQMGVVDKLREREAERRKWKSS